MKWTPEAENAIKKVPFFVRKKVRARVEKEAADNGRPVVSLEDVNATRNRFMNQMDSEVRGYQLDACFGASGCPNSANSTESLSAKIEAILKDADLAAFLRQQVGGPLKFHHEFRVTLCDCPNACSQPQIKDIGVIGACLPEVTGDPCSGCGLCVSTCPDNAVTLDGDKNGISIDYEKCLACGQCIRVCPTGTLKEGKKGFKILLGGKLGRHPKLAEPLPGIYSEDEVLKIVENCLKYYKANSTGGKRFADCRPSDLLSIHT